MSPCEMPTTKEHVLRQTYVEGGYIISTIRLLGNIKALDNMIGVLESVVGDIGRADINSGGDYESMVFPGTLEDGITDWEELDFRRYSTEAEALAGHDELVESWTAMPAGMKLTYPGEE